MYMCADVGYRSGYRKDGSEIHWPVFQPINTGAKSPVMRSPRDCYVHKALLGCIGSFCPAGCKPACTCALPSHFAWLLPTYQAGLLVVFPGSCRGRSRNALAHNCGTLRQAVSAFTRLVLYAALDEPSLKGIPLRHKCGPAASSAISGQGGQWTLTMCLRSTTLASHIWFPFYLQTG